MPGGRLKAFRSITMTRGPTPLTVSAEANKGLRVLGRMSDHLSQGHLFGKPVVYNLKEPLATGDTFSGPDRHLQQGNAEQVGWPPALAAL